MTSNNYARKCGSCPDGVLKRNGTRKTKKGRTQRWICTVCGASTVLARPSRAKAWWARAWLSWLLADRTLDELGVSMRTFQRHTAPFWATSPAAVFDGVVRDVLVIDATRIGASMCHIIAEPPPTRASGRHREKATVVAWGWATTESSASWGALMARIPPPKVVVADAQSGILKAAAQWWPQTRIQICAVHAARNLHAKTGKRPDQFALRTARGLATMIMTTASLRQADGWTALTGTLEEFLGPFLKQKTDRPAEGGKRPWHYTHRTARSAWNTLLRHARTSDVFTWLEPGLQAACDRPIPATTNDVEGGINAPLKHLIRHHRGLTKPRQRVLADWYLATRTETPPDPARFLLNPNTHQPRHAHKATDFVV